MSARLIFADVRHGIPLPDGSVQCVVTSPPYWNLRDYGTGPDQWGQEPTPEEFIATSVKVFREVRRVLRADGTLWLNIGDSYASKPNGSIGDHSTLEGGMSPHADYRRAHAGRTRSLPKGLKHKDMVGIPWMLAFALRADGWYLRSEIIWHKPNPMPESATDRPTKAHETLFLLAKSARYFYDADAIREPAKSDRVRPAPEGWQTGSGSHSALEHSRRERKVTPRGAARPHSGFNDRWDGMSRAEQQAKGANKRSVWTIATRAFTEAHFATFPEALVEPCILAGTSAAGECATCGAQWRRMADREFVPQPDVATSPALLTAPSSVDPSNGWAGTPRGTTTTITIGWEPSCTCDAGDPIPQTVLDICAGSGTTGVVALRSGRAFIGFDNNHDYLDMARRRISGDAPLLNTVEMAGATCD